MTNLAILEQECRNRGITEVVHTFAKWKSLGYKVKKRRTCTVLHTTLETFI